MASKVLVDLRKDGQRGFLTGGCYNAIRRRDSPRWYSSRKKTELGLPKSPDVPHPRRKLLVEDTTRTRTAPQPRPQHRSRSSHAACKEGEVRSLADGDDLSDGSVHRDEELRVLGDGGDDEVAVGLDALGIVSTVDLKNHQHRREGIRTGTHLPRDRLVHRRRPSPPKHILELGPPASTRSKVVTERYDDLARGNVLSGSESSLSEIDGVGEFAKSVFLKVVVVASLQSTSAISTR